MNKPRKPVQWNELPHAGAATRPMHLTAEQNEIINRKSEPIRITHIYQSGKLTKVVVQNQFGNNPIDLRYGSDSSFPGFGGYMNRNTPSWHQRLLRFFKQKLNGTYLPKWTRKVPLSELCPVLGIRGTSRKHYRKEMAKLKKKYN